jgi:hypothetical protein
MLLLSVEASRALEPDHPLALLTGDELAPNAKAVAGPGGQAAIEVRGETGKSTTTIVNCTAPTISTHQYVVRGQVKYDSVAGDGYLELWNDFGPKGKFFSRSLGEFGAMRKLNGTSSWRKFELPFFAEPGMQLEKLTLNVVLPGAGTVTVAQPVLFTIDRSHDWWTEQQAGLFGAIYGGLVGTLGAVIGCLAGWGKAKRLTLGLFAFGIAISAISLAAGLIALSLHQPWHVHYPMLLGGIIGVSVLGGNLWNLLRRYRADELRRIAAVDA